MSDEAQGDGWWQASDSKWYPPESHPNRTPPPPPTLPPPAQQSTPTSAQSFQGDHAPASAAPMGRLEKLKKPLWKRWWFIGFALLIVVIVFASAVSPKDDETPEESSGNRPDPTSAPDSLAAAPTQSISQPEPQSGLTPTAQDAVRSAESYLDFGSFSRQGLIDQLEFEDYSTSDATVAVDSLNVDWNAQAAGSAKSYLDFSGFSCQGLIDQLEFEGFTASQATYGATQAGICGSTDAAPAQDASGLTPTEQNAVRSAESYLDFGSFSRQGLIDQLEFEDYSTSDATFAVDSLNVDWNAQAAGSAKSYLDFSGFSCQGLIDQLEFEGYTASQATYGATQAGIC